MNKQVFVNELSIMKFETFIREIIPRTFDTSSFRFPRPEGFDYKPGQYMMVTIKSDEKEIVHTFSLSSSPTDPDFIEFTKKFTLSEYSARLKSMKNGDWARIDGPYGKFTCECEYEKILFLAGGIGITPFFSIIKYCTDNRLPTNIVLFYGCRNESEIAFKKELEDIQQKNSNLKVIPVLNEPNPGWTGKVGFVTPDLIRQEVPDFRDRVFYACGPPVMVAAMQKLVAALGLPIEHLRLESLVGYT
jgi:ferredoxin-NADP reductase